MKSNIKTFGSIILSLIATQVLTGCIGGANVTNDRTLASYHQRLELEAYGTWPKDKEDTIGEMVESEKAKFQKIIYTKLKENDACMELTSKVVTHKNLGNQIITGETGDVNIAHAKNVDVSGKHQSLRIGIAEKVSVKGETRQVSVLAADHIKSISGVEHDICIRSESANSILGSANSETKSRLALVSTKMKGLSQAAVIEAKNGNDVLLVRYSVKHLKGVKETVHVFGGVIEKLSGVTGEIHLYDGAKIKEFAGQFGRVVHH